MATSPIAIKAMPKRTSLKCYGAETVELGLRTAAAGFPDPDVHQSLSQTLKCDSLTPHEAPELAQLQAGSYV